MTIKETSDETISLQKLLERLRAEVSYHFDGTWFSGRLTKICCEKVPDEIVAVTQGRSMKEFVKNLEDIMDEAEACIKNLQKKQKSS